MAGNENKIFKKMKKKNLLLTNENKRVRERTGDYDAEKKRM